MTTGTALLPSRKVPLQPKEVDGHARLVCFASDFNFCLSWQNFKADFLNDGGELGPRPLSQERETTRCVDLNKNPDNFFQHPGGVDGSYPAQPLVHFYDPPPGPLQGAARL